MKKRNLKTKVAFAFVDEVGVGYTVDQPLFGVGIFFIQDTLNITRVIHDIFTGAVSAYQKHKSRFEFKFNAVTTGNLSFYKAIVNALAKDTGWSFSAVLIEKPAEWSSKDYWPAYLSALDKLLTTTPTKKITLVADYLAKPKRSRRDLFGHRYKDKILNLLQLESQGSLLLQVADVLLGAIHFEERRNLLQTKKAKKAKVKLAKLVKKLLKEAELKGKAKIQKMTAIEWLHAVKNNFIL